MSSYANQSHTKGLLLRGDEETSLVFTENDRRAAYRDVGKETKDSLSRLALLQNEANSHQARVLRGVVACGVSPIISEYGHIYNYDVLVSKMWAEQESGNLTVAQHIAGVIGLREDSIIGDGR